MNSIRFNLLQMFEYTDRGLCIGLGDRETDFPPASTCGILSQDRRHKFIPLDSSCRINRASAAPIHTLVFFLLHLYTRASAAHARERAEATLSSNQQKPTTTFYRLALFPA